MTSAHGGASRRISAHLSPQERLCVLRDATSALVYLHTPSAAKPWTALHGDIKASNILLEPSRNLLGTF